MKKVVYHGTTEERAKKILSDGFISVTTDNNKRYCTTNSGCVYVTTDFYQAIDFSTRPEKEMKDYTVIIFEIFIDEKELCQDKDEEKWKSTLDTQNGYANCFVIKRCLRIGVDVTRIYRKYFCDSDRVGKFMQDVQYDCIKINDTDKEWENLKCQN